MTIFSSASVIPSSKGSSCLRAVDLLSVVSSKRSWSTEIAAVLRGEIEAEERKSANVERFLSVVERYTEIPELTPCILHEFVEKIVVHAASDPKGKNRTQEIDIYYKGIGALEVSKVTSSRQEWEKRHSRSYTVSLLPHDVFLSGGTFWVFPLFLWDLV